MLDLSTTYLGLNLKNPLVASASPLSKKVSSVKRLEDAGISAVVMYSLFEEQISHESRALDFYLTQGTESYAEALTFFPDLDHYNVGPEEYLELISKLKSEVSIPVIGSLNGVTTGGWVDYASKIEEAGADALELNVYNVPTDPGQSAQELEQLTIDLVGDVRRAIKIPLAVKLSPFYTSLPNMAQRLVKAGANGLVLFNRFIQPDIDIEMLEVNPQITLSTAEEIRLPLRWTAILYGKIKTDFALSSGVHGAPEVVKAVMAGANAAMMASELIANGPDQAAAILADLQKWMTDYDYESIKQMRGSMSQQSVSDPSAYERGNYMKALTSFDEKAR